MSVRTSPSGTQAPLAGSPDSCQGCSGAARSSIQAKAEKAAAEREPLRCVFMGTPDFAAIILDRLLAAPHVTVPAVYTQPDRPAGRGKKTTPPPVKRLALEHGLPVFQPVHFRADPAGDAAVAGLAALAPDVLVVAAYGLILPQRVLDIPRLLPVNVHASLLPKYRGAAPIQRAVMAGDAVTGVTIMRMVAALDAGPILMQRAVGIDINDTSGALHDELAREGAELLVQSLERLSAGTLGSMPQDDSLTTYAPKLSKEEGLLDFSLSGRELHARIRGLTPWPGAAMHLHRKDHDPLMIHAGPGCFPLSGHMRDMADAYLSCAVKPATHKASIIGVMDKALLVTCGSDCYAFTGLRPSGRNSMDGLAFYNGYLAGARGAFFSGKERV